MCGYLGQFIEILDILVISSFVLFFVEVYHTEEIDDHILGFLISHTHHTSVVQLSHSYSFQVYCAHTYLGGNCMYICMHSHVENTSNN